MQVNGTRMPRATAAAQVHEASPATIYPAIEPGHVTALKLGSGRALRVPETALPAYEQSRQVAARAGAMGSPAALDGARDD